MCGIAGYVYRDGRPARGSAIKRMTEVIRHRGPDAEGGFCFENSALGHVRLSIIDLSKLANQPMHSGNDRFTISYNGEVYNYRELRKELEERGHHFKSASDTEVILNAYIEWGADCVPRFNGMFAFAVSC